MKWFSKERSPAAWRRLRLTAAVTFAVALIAIPTLFSIFPSWTHWPLVGRVLLVISWLAVAVVTALLASRADDRLHAIVEADQRALIRAERRAVLSDQFDAVLAPAVHGLPGHFQVTVYAPTPDGKFLIPISPPAVNLEDPAIFAAGAGATGKAWSDPTGVFVVTGKAVSDDTHGLTRMQQRRYKMFSTVAAVVIRDTSDTPIGVLTAISRHEGPFEEEVVTTMKDLADGVSWLIPAAVPWMMPEREAQ